MWGLYLAFHILQVTKRGSAKEKGRHSIREEEKARHAMSEKRDNAMREKEGRHVMREKEKGRQCNEKEREKETMQ